MNPATTELSRSLSEHLRQGEQKPCGIDTNHHENWNCPKCDNVEFETDIFQATGGTFAKIFDVQNKKFTTVTCTRCQYTEIYKASTSNLGNVFDFFTS